jgi:hypothetical protein
VHVELLLVNSLLCTFRSEAAGRKVAIYTAKDARSDDSVLPISYCIYAISLGHVDTIVSRVCTSQTKRKSSANPPPPPLSVFTFFLLCLASQVRVRACRAAGLQHRCKMITQKNFFDYVGLHR